VHDCVVIEIDYHIHEVSLVISQIKHIVTFQGILLLFLDPHKIDKLLICHILDIKEVLVDVKGHL